MSRRRLLGHGNKNRLKNQIEKLLSIDFGGFSHDEFKSGKQDVDEFGKTATNYERKLDPEQYGVFDTLNLTTYDDEPWVFTFLRKNGNKINFDDVEKLTEKLIEINGPDDNEKKTLLATEFEEINSNHVDWSGRSWIKRGNYPMSFFETRKDGLTLQVKAVE